MHLQGIRLRSLADEGERDLAAFRQTLAQVDDVNSIDLLSGETALHFAAYAESKAPAVLLLEAGADPNRLDFAGDAPLTNAVMNPAAFIALLGNGAQADEEVRKACHRREIVDILNEYDQDSAAFCDTFGSVAVAKLLITNIAIGLASLDLPVLVLLEIENALRIVHYNAWRPSPDLLWQVAKRCKFASRIS